MICKHAEDTPPRDAREAAGQRAERQMAFYLDRAFAASEHVRVFNSLRFERTLSDGSPDAVQIDHLLLHRHGVIIIESKSVQGGAFVINARGEFSRVHGREERGEPSPLLQARRQGEALREMLQAKREELRERYFLGLRQGGFKTCPIEVLVAVSDSGMIKGKAPPEVVKADAAADAARAIIERHRAGASLLSKLDDKDSGLYSFSPAEAERVAAFLLEHHRPRVAPATAAPPPPPSMTPKPTMPKPTASPPAASPQAALARPEPAPSIGPPPAMSPTPLMPRPAPPVAPAPPTPVAQAAPLPPPAPRPPVAPVAQAAPLPPAGHACRHCGSAAIADVRFANRAYFAVCAACKKGTDLDARCAACGERARVRKDGPVFTRVCDVGGSGCGATAEVVRVG